MVDNHLNTINIRALDKSVQIQDHISCQTDFPI